MKLEQRTVLITGGTSGIGHELARQLLARGNTVIVTGRDPSRLAATAAALPGVHTFCSDVADPEQVAALRVQVLEQFPGLDTLVNNAGVMRNLDFNRVERIEDITREVDINLSGLIHVTQQFLPKLRSQPHALLINVSSGLAFVPFPSAPVYSASKAAVRAFTRALRVQLRSTGASVKVVELAPPGTETPLFRDEFEAELVGQKGMDVELLVRKAIKCIESGSDEVRPGLSNVLELMSRLMPELMLGQLAKSFRPQLQT
ncbi:MAG: SDR family oxidoreductase [Rhodanobacter sp.]